MWRAVITQMLISAGTSVAPLRWHNEMKGTVLLSGPWANRRASWCQEMSKMEREAGISVARLNPVSLPQHQRWGTKVETRDKMGQDDCNASDMCANSLTPFPCCSKASLALHPRPTREKLERGDKATSTLAPSCGPSDSLCSTHQLIINHRWR